MLQQEHFWFQHNMARKAFCSNRWQFLAGNSIYLKISHVTKIRLSHKWKNWNSPTWQEFSALDGFFMNSTRSTDTVTRQPSKPTSSLPRVVIDLEKLRHINCGLGRFSLYLARELLARSDNFFEPIFFIPDNSEHYFKNVTTTRYSSIRVHPWHKECFQRWIRPIARHFHTAHRPAPNM